MPGPVPKRSDQRRRRNSDGPDLVTAPAGKAPAVPRVSGDWHPIAARWFRSLKESGQAQFYEASDWSTAYYIAEAMSRNLEQGKFSAQLFQSVLSGMTDLLTTEGARRRARVELERLEQGEDPREAAHLVLMEQYRQAAEGGSA
ncbi:hypothetical protein OG196_15120 [Kitasatospora purpeofusca]|uniref:phage terminase small subunit n=1 Tax=Kitasatospora purpeofusca TaxID=67352 RepID=UPI002E12C609|nr:hypothetical protein OG196_15120 [Kitasatospora purpeofusca]